MTRDDLINKVKAKRRDLEVAKESNAFCKCIWIEGQIHALEMLIMTRQDCADKCGVCGREIIESDYYGNHCPSCEK